MSVCRGLLCIATARLLLKQQRPRCWHVQGQNTMLNKRIGSVDELQRALGRGERLLDRLDDEVFF